MAGNTVGQAYIQIIPTTRGIASMLSKSMSAPATVGGKAAGKSIAGGIMKVIAAAGIGKVIATSISEGSKLQQSLGGVETLFKGSADRVKKYASQSFKTTGLSANAYMENVTSFSAALIHSLGGNTKKAAELSNTAMKDMSDNANKMGTDMESITQTYQSLARGNYAMLDNLKLGYGGTKSEMQRLMKDAEKLTGEHYTVGDFGDTVKAIHAIQDNLGITGTTAREAATTFEGSFKQMKASATDLLGNIALGKDIRPSLKNLISSTKTFLIGNLLPMVQNIVKEIPAVISGLGPAMKQLLPPLIKGAGEILTGVIQALANAAPQFAALAVTLAGALVKGLASVDWGAVGSVILKGIGNSFKSNPGATAAGIAALGLYMKSKLSGMFSNLPGLTSGLSGAMNQFKTFRMAAMGMQGPMLKGATTSAKIGAAFRKLGSAAKAAGKAIWGSMKKMGRAIAGVFKAIGKAMLANPWLIAIAAAVVAAILIIKNWKKVKAFLLSAWNAIKNVAGTIWNGIKTAIMAPVNALKGHLSKVWVGIKGAASKSWQGIKAVAGKVWGGIKGTIGKSMSGAKKHVQTQLAAMKKSYKKHGGGIKGTVAALGTWQINRYRSMYNKINSLTGGKLGTALKITRSKFSSMKSAVADKMNALKNKISDILGKIKDAFSRLVLKIPKPHLPHVSVSWSKVSKGKVHIDVPTLHWNAKGGIFTRPTLLGGGNVVGEAGAEAVLPLSRLWKHLDAMADSIVNGVSVASQAASAGGPQTINITLYADKNGAKLGEWVVNTYDTYKRRLG
jgi:phage-related protein